MYSRRSASRPDLLCLANSTLTLTQDDALSVLEYWQHSAERLMLVYRRADAVTRIGQGRVRNATARELRIDTDAGRLRVAMHSAGFEFGTLAARPAPCLREAQSDGLLIRPKLDDWLFLRAAPARQPGRLREPASMVHPGSPRHAYY